MTPKQLEQKAFDTIFKIQHGKLDTDEGESNEEEEKSITSSEKSALYSKPDTYTEDEQETNMSEKLQIHNHMNETTHDKENQSETEDDTSENVLCIKSNHN